MQLPVPLPLDGRLLDPRLYLRLMDDIHTLSSVAVRALDDLHRIAVVVESLEDVETRLTRRIDSVERVVEDGIVAVRSLASVENRAVELLRAAEEISGNLPLLREGLEAVRVLNVAATTLAAAVEPLQGATDRLARIADRLPGGGARRRGASG